MGWAGGRGEGRLDQWKGRGEGKKQAGDHLGIEGDDNWAEHEEEIEARQSALGDSLGSRAFMLWMGFCIFDIYPVCNKLISGFYTPSQSRMLMTGSNSRQNDLYRSHSGYKSSLNSKRPHQRSSVVKSGRSERASIASWFNNQSQQGMLCCSAILDQKRHINDIWHKPSNSRETHFTGEETDFIEKNEGLRRFDHVTV
ncbi:hypothetical protein PoB_005757800 [Plakobranchus ocellatus]|uniref:Uncharacterized protein n=1 Tax=Plakobranchus ocellatus TaxID=259542 RepID=A0AAV4CGI9_9GAST|nr:hypothetical protein PoB_005757800 [Plakobranchus ocellatus]